MRSSRFASHEVTNSLESSFDRLTTRRLSIRMILDRAGEAGSWRFERMKKGCLPTVSWQRKRK